MLQQMMTLSAASRTTSYSSSFHPLSDFSIKTCGLRLKLLALRSRSSSSFSAKPDPSPPSENADRRMTGYPIFSAAFSASLTVETATELAAGIPISTWAKSCQHAFVVLGGSSARSRALQNKSRSSDTSSVRIGVPRTLTPSRSNTPILSN